VQTIRDAIKSRDEITVRILNYTRGGKPFWNMFTLAPMKDSNGETRFLVGVQVGREAADVQVREQPAIPGSKPGYQGASCTYAIPECTQEKICESSQVGSAGLRVTMMSSIFSCLTILPVWAGGQTKLSAYQQAGASDRGWCSGLAVLKANGSFHWMASAYVDMCPDLQAASRATSHICMPQSPDSLQQTRTLFHASVLCILNSWKSCCCFVSQHVRFKECPPAAAGSQALPG
jgi:hypothetical protein